MSRHSRSYSLFLPFLSKDPRNLCDQDYFSGIRHFFSDIYRINRLHANMRDNSDVLLSHIINEAFIKEEFSTAEMDRLRQWFMDQRFRVVLAGLYNWTSGFYNHLSYLFHAKHHIKVINNHGHVDIRVIQSPLVLLYNFLAAGFLDKGPSGSTDMMSFLLQGVDDSICHDFFDDILKLIEIDALLETQFTGKSILEICDREITPIKHDVTLDSLKLIKTVYAQFTDWLDEVENAPMNRVIHFVLRLYDAYQKNNTLTQEEVKTLLYSTKFYGLIYITDTNESLWISQFIKILMTVLFVIRTANDLPITVLENLYKTFEGNHKALLDKAMRFFRNNPFFQLLWDHLVVLLHPIENKNDVLEEHMQKLSTEVIVVIAHNVIDMWNIKQCQESSSRDQCLRENSVSHQALVLRSRYSSLNDKSHRFSEKKKASNQKTNVLYRSLNRRAPKTYEDGLRDGIAKGTEAHQSFIRSRLKKIGFSILLALSIAALTYLIVQTFGVALIAIAASTGVWAGVGAVTGVGFFGLAYQYKEKIKALLNKKTQGNNLLEQQQNIHLALPKLIVLEEPQPILMTAPINKDEAERRIMTNFNIKEASNDNESEDYHDVLLPMRQASGENADTISIRSLVCGSANVFSESRLLTSSPRHSAVLEGCGEEEDYGCRYT